MLFRSVFGFPVYGGRLFNEAKSKLLKIKGNNTLAVATVTYGNRDFDDALIELFDTLKELSFNVIAGAALIGEHTYGKIATERPNQDDLEKNKIFAMNVLNKINEKDFKTPLVDGNYPYKDGGNKGRFFTKANENCVRCGKCQKRCPKNAIDLIDFSITDENKCISCLRCLKE